MNFIEHIVEPDRLLLAWQAPELAGDRTRFLVGELIRDRSLGGGEYIRLIYHVDTDDAKRAAKLSYIGYPTFPLKDGTEYRSGVLQTFLRRLPPRSRSDFQKFLDNFRLLSYVPISDFALLGYSEAKLPSDGFSLVHPFENVDGPFEFLLEVAGFRHYSSNSMTLSVGMQVRFDAEPHNKHDSHAIAISVGDLKIGYVNRLQSKNFSLWIRNRRVIGTLERLNGRRDYPRAFVFVTVR